MKKLVLLFVTSICFGAQAQDVFTYGNKGVSKDEFLRMYTKNNINKAADMSEKALQEYVTLYSRFKMKVAEAEANKIDTLPNIKNELETYKKQLSKGFLTDKDVINNLSKETYDRVGKEIEVAHIMVTLPRGGGNDTIKQKKLIDSLYNELKANKVSFSDVAIKFSEDKGTAVKGGSLGFITALQTPYAFESAAYLLKPGSISAPIRTNFGYHIIKKISERKSRGDVQVAHILCTIAKSKGEEGKALAKARIDSAAAALKSGTAWSDVVKQFSQDKFTINSDGNLEPFGVGKMAPAFEEAAYGLKKENEISQIVETEFGYHILKLIKKMPLRTYEEMKNELNRKIEKDNRVEVAKQAFINKIKIKNKFTETMDALTVFGKLIPDSFTQNNTVRIPEKLASNPVLFTLLNKQFMAMDFAKYLNESSRGLLYGTKESALGNSYKAFVEKSVLDVEEANLATENKEYANLLKEYRDGIILFDLTDKSVWTKASTDTTGLEIFYTKNKTKYMWGPSFNGKQLRCEDKATAEALQKALQKYATTEDATSAVDSTGTKISTESARYELDKIDPQLKNIQENVPSAIIKNSDNTYSIYMAKELFKSTAVKSLTDAKGYVIADYQDYLEKEWIASMEAKYPVKVNQTVLKSMVGKGPMVPLKKK